MILCTEGFKEAAEKIRVESGIQPNMELDGLDDRIKIRDPVQNGHIADAIALVNSLHPELLDQDRYLFFHLQVINYKTRECLCNWRYLLLNSDHLEEI